MTIEQFNEMRKEVGTFCSRVGVRGTKIEPGYCEVECEAGPMHRNPWGMTHGGLLFTLVDVAGCWAAAAVKGLDGFRPVVTESAAIHYLRPAGAGKLTAKARTVKSGKTVAYVTVDVYDEQDRHLIRGDVTAFYTGELTEDLTGLFKK